MDFLLVTLDVVLSIIVVVVLLIILAYIFTYNKFIQLRNRIDECWAQVNIQIKRRFDLIPNLIEVVKGYSKYEQETFTKVIEARRMGLKFSGNNKQELIDADNLLTESLKSIFALHEAYPELKANNSFQTLQHELTITKNKIAYSRQLYNSIVMSFNNKIEFFPTNIVANLHHFSKREMLSISAEEREVPKVSF